MPKEVNVVDTVQPIEKEAWRVRLSRGPEDLSEIIKLSETTPRKWDVGFVNHEAFARWLSTDNPYGSPKIVYAEDKKTGSVAGFVFALAYKIKIGEKYHRCYMGCFGLTHEDFRRTSIYGDILKIQDQACLTDGVTIYGFPAIYALYRLQGAGFKTLTHVPLLIRPLDIGALASHQFKRPLLRLGVTCAWTIGANTVLRPYGTRASRWGLEIATENDFDESFDTFWETVAPKFDQIHIHDLPWHTRLWKSIAPKIDQYGKPPMPKSASVPDDPGGNYPVVIVRDRAFLAWRFRGAEFRHYTILTARSGGELVGYVVLGNSEINGVRTGLIADLLVEDGPRGDAAGLLLVNEGTRRMRADGMALAGSLMMPHTQEYAILCRAGYMDAPTKVAPTTFRIMMKPFRGAESKYEGTLPRRDRTFFTIADHDAI
jgi:hypothetical protein